MLKHRKASRKTSAIKSATTLFAISTAAIIGSPHAIAGPTVIGVDGTTVHIPIDIFDGALDVNHRELQKLPGYDVVTIDYPRSFGILTLGGPGYDKSVSIGKQKTITEIKKAQNGDPSVPVKLACYSQGADVCTQVNEELWKSGYDQSAISYLMLGSVDNAEAGAKVRFPYIGEKGVFIPFAGVTLGNAKPTSGSDAQITQLLYEYDFFARAPQYPLHLISLLNAAIGTAFEHGSYRWANPYDPRNIVSTTPDGKITNIMIPVNEVPLLTLARFLGMPRVVANVINPTLKAIVDTGYGTVPNGPGTYPTEATPFKVFRSKEERQEDALSIQKGFAESKARLEALLRPPTTGNKMVVSSDQVIVDDQLEQNLSHKTTDIRDEAAPTRISAHRASSKRGERLASKAVSLAPEQHTGNKNQGARSTRNSRHSS